MAEAACITFIIPVYNESRRIISCLDSIALQSYPHDCIQILIPDGMSEDNTRAVITEWAASHDIEVQIIDNPRRITEFGTALALHLARGEYFVLFAADNHLVGTDWIQTALTGFAAFPDIFGVEALYHSIPGGRIVNNYLTHTLHISDPLARDMAVKPLLNARLSREGRNIRKYLIRPGYPTGANGFMFRMKDLQKYLSLDTFEEGQVALDFGLQGDRHFAQIEGHGIYHFFTDSFRSYLAKRAKIALKHQTRIQERKTWTHYTGRRLYLFALLNLTFIYPLGLSLLKLVQSGDALWLLHAPMAWITTWIYAWNWLKIKLTGKKAW